MNVDTSAVSVEAVMLEVVRKGRAEDSEDRGVKHDAAVRAWARKDAMAKASERRIGVGCRPLLSDNNIFVRL